MKLYLRLALSLAVAAGLLGVLMAVGGVGPAEMVSGLRRLSFSTYVCALALQAGVYLLRALRFRVLLPEPLDGKGHGLLRFFSITSSYTLAATVLPAKVGEASFVVYANRVAGVPASEAFASLIVSRLFDFATLALGMALACLAMWASGAVPQAPWIGPLGVVLLPVAFALLAASTRGDLLLRGAASVSRLLGLGRTRVGTRMLAASERVAQAVRTAGSRRRLVAAFFLTLPAWVGVFLYCAVLARGLGLPPETSFAEATFGSGLAILASLAPVSAFANFGTLEAGWVLGFRALGVGADLAYATGIGLHVVQLANAVLLGVLGHVGMALATGRARTPEAAAPVRPPRR